MREGIQNSRGEYSAPLLPRNLGCRAGEARFGEEVEKFGRARPLALGTLPLASLGPNRVLRDSPGGAARSAGEWKVKPFNSIK